MPFLQIRTLVTSAALVALLSPVSVVTQGQQEPAAPPGGAAELDQARGNPQRGKSGRHRGEGSEQRACRAPRSVARPSLAASSVDARGAADAPAPAQGAEGVALTVSRLRVVSRPGR